MQARPVPTGFQHPTHSHPSKSAHNCCRYRPIGSISRANTIGRCAKPAYPAHNRCLKSTPKSFYTIWCLTQNEQCSVDRLRCELQAELDRSSAKTAVNHQQVQQQIEGSLTQEIESHTCPICYELMVAPQHAPILLFPCGAPLGNHHSIVA